MKSAEFKYVRPDTVDDALALKAEFGEGAEFLAGGQSLLPTLNMRLSQPDALIDINGLNELDGISCDNGVVRIGALTRTGAVGRSDIVRWHLPMLHECVDYIAHPAIRNLGTFGGSVALGDQAAEWPACCLALEGTIVLRGQTGERAVAASEFFQGTYATARRPDEMLVRVEFPAQPRDVKPVVLELARRRGDFAIVGLVAQARRGLEDLRIAFFGVSDRPVRLPELETTIRREPTLEQAYRLLEDQLPADSDLYHEARTKIYLTKVLLGQAIRKLTV